MSDSGPIILRRAGEPLGEGRAVGAPLPGAFNPAPGWCLEDARGYMAFEGPGDVDGRRLVLLRDVVQWIVKARQSPLRVVVRDVVSDLAVESAASWLYMTAPNDYARAMREDDCFEEGVGLWLLSFSDSHGVDTSRRGLVGLLQAMREHWGADGFPNPEQVKSKGLEALDAAAIRMDVAHALWGWGTVAAAEDAPATVSADPLASLNADLRGKFAAVCKARESSNSKKSGAREKWLDEDVETVRKVREALGRTGAKTIAPLLGMSADGVRGLLESKAKAKAAASAPTANNPFNQAKTSRRA